MSEELGDSLPFDNLTQLRKLLIGLYPDLERLDEVPFNEWKPLKVGKMVERDFINSISDFYLTNPIARASSVMSDLSANAKARANSKLAAE